MTTTKLDENDVLDALRQVIDPELGCNLVDLGLIYDIAIEGAKVTVRMTLTTPGCPMHEGLTQGAQNAVLNLEDVEEVDVQLVWDPPWDPSMMTEKGKKELGMR